LYGTQFEHSDERLFEYLDGLAQQPTGTPQVLARYLIATDEAAAIPPVSDVFGRWNPDTDELTFWQSKVVVQEVVDELYRVQVAAERELAKP